jgi:hypothetical protein
LRSFKCDDFVVHFLLWGHGGPNFVREHSLWESEESQSWQAVGRRSFADIVRDPLSGANRVPLGRQHVHQPVVLQPPAIPRLAFLHQLPVKDMELLEATISSVHNLDRILMFF